MSSLTIVVETSHPVGYRAAWELTRAWWGSVGGSVGWALAPRGGPCVRIGLGSIVRPSAVVRFDVPFAAADDADHLALTIAAWDALDALEVWRSLSAPLPIAPRYGTPSATRPWALTWGGLGGRARAPGGHQLHVVGGVPRAGTDHVWWPRWPRLVAALLGRAACVIGEADPLVYDAYRGGIVVRGLDGVTREPPREPSLAGLVAPSLATDPELWRHVARTARDVHLTRRPPAPLMSTLWIARGRERIRTHLTKPPSTWARIKRRHDKLRRDPKRFFADSSYASMRAIGQLVFSEETD